MTSATSSFHPAVRRWLSDTYAGPTEVQERAWPAIRRGEHVLVAAPTGSGKTLCAFVNAIDVLVRQSEHAALPAQTFVLYVSPLKALSRDIEHNLKEPLIGITRRLRRSSEAEPEIRTSVRTGDTPTHERTKQAKKPAHILVTTPESLYILLTTDSGRRALGAVNTVIVDEIHALVRDKRGSHLSLSLERLDALLAENSLPRAQRIGLSATQRPISTVAHFLSGWDPSTNSPRPCTIIDEGHERPLDLALCAPDEPLAAVMSAQGWENIYDQLTELTLKHKTTLVFTNTRKLVERVGRFLSERLGRQLVATHHGSLSKERRLAAEQDLKAGRVRVLVASASLELGIDIGDVELVCQLGSPRGISTFLQRVGRSGHWVGGLPKGRLFPMTRDDLVECVALLWARQSGKLDRLELPEQPLDILSQQIVAHLVPGESSVVGVYDLVRGAYPFRDLDEERFMSVLEMLSDGFSTARGRRGALIHLDTVGQRIKARKSARLIATTNGGAIADNFDFDVVLTPQDIRVGSVHEDFAVESSPGDVFQLGNTSYQVQRVQGDRVLVSDAHGAPPSLPFWLGEAPGRSNELSTAVSHVRALASGWQSDAASGSLQDHLQTRLDLEGVPKELWRQLSEYLQSACIALGDLPTQEQIIAERFFDESGNMHVVVHSPFGTRLNRAFGLALRKRFCRSFNVELQAAITDDAIVLSLGPMHSFPLASIFQLLHSKVAQDTLTQALLDAPLFGTRFRWNASRALAVRRFAGGKRVPPKFQRIAADDLLAVCFPDQVACLENIGTHREIPSHPLVEQTLHDCLREAMDLPGLLSLLQKIENHEVRTLARDLTEPSPLAHEVIAARPYAFLDDAPLEERRTQAIYMRRFATVESARDLAELSPEAIEQVLAEARPLIRDEDELHDALFIFGFFKSDELPQAAWVENLVASHRAYWVETGAAPLLIAAERYAWYLSLFGAPPLHPRKGPKNLSEITKDKALREVVRSRTELVGPTTATELAEALGLPHGDIQVALAALEGEGFVLRGRFRAGANEDEYCQRGLLARIHRLTLARLRKEIEPVSPVQFVEFLVQYQGLTPATKRRGIEGTLAAVEQLSGFWAAAQTWEDNLLARRVIDFSPNYLNELAQQGKIVWRGSSGGSSGRPRFSGSTSVSFCRRAEGPLFLGATLQPDQNERAGPDARRLLALMQQRGALFYDELTSDAKLLPSQAEDALSELLSLGLVTCDHMIQTRRFLSSKHKNGSARARRGRSSGRRITPSGRFSEVRGEPALEGGEDPRAELYALRLLQRWGVVFKKLLEREQPLLPWYELRRVLSRLEAQGEIRGGRFVDHISGEQFATPEAISLLRSVRRASPTNDLIWISSYDPLNLRGILDEEPKIPRSKSTLVALLQGRFVAVNDRGALTSLIKSEDDAAIKKAATEALSRTQGESGLYESSSQLRQQVFHAGK